VLDTIGASTQDRAETLPGPAAVSPPALAGQTADSSQAGAGVKADLKIQARRVSPNGSQGAANATADRQEVPSKAAE